MFPEGAIVTLHVWRGGLLLVGVCVGGVRCVGHGHGGSVGIRTLGGGVVIFTRGSVGAVCTLGRGEWGGPTVGSWAVAQVVITA